MPSNSNSNSNNVWNVNSTGNLNNKNANNAGGVRPFLLSTMVYEHICHEEKIRKRVLFLVIRYALI